MRRLLSVALLLAATVALASCQKQETPTQADVAVSTRQVRKNKVALKDGATAISSCTGRCVFRSASPGDLWSVRSASAIT